MTSDIPGLVRDAEQVKYCWKWLCFAIFQLALIYQQVLLGNLYTLYIEHPIFSPQISYVFSNLICVIHRSVNGPRKCWSQGYLDYSGSTVSHFSTTVQCESEGKCYRLSTSLSMLFQIYRSSKFYWQMEVSRIHGENNQSVPLAHKVVHLYWVYYDKKKLCLYLKTSLYCSKFLFLQIYAFKKTSNKEIWLIPRKTKYNSDFVYR